MILGMSAMMIFGSVLIVMKNMAPATIFHLWTHHKAIFRLSFFSFFFFPGAFGRFGDETFFERAGGHADVAHFAAGHKRFDALQIHMEFALGDRRDVRADAAGFF
jgi:hypothetical protein